jgi:hypothetical protein
LCPYPATSPRSIPPFVLPGPLAQAQAQAQDTPVAPGDASGSRTSAASQQAPCRGDPPPAGYVLSSWPEPPRSGPARSAAVRKTSSRPSPRLVE